MEPAPNRDLVLVHSPLVGPLSWQPTAVALDALGFRCQVPTAGASSMEPVPWKEWPERLAASLPGVRPDAVAGHSGAGLLLPALAHRLGARALVFVDAQIPPESGWVRPVSGDLEQFVDALPVTEGLLPRWSEWWPPRAMQELIPDATVRQRFEADQPRLPKDWFDDALEVPAWDTLATAYVRTSGAYTDQAAQAQAKGWPVAIVDGTHLHPYLAPAETAGAIATVLGELGIRP